ncbi:MAG: putative methyltransferase [Solirubrobacterales bacterium]|jgi:ubiquinone/menaquinone biosynthesis C-methylase UbiE|nr:putative methyltransferase [Solirubrobacterales bacterium]
MPVGDEDTGAVARDPGPAQQAQGSVNAYFDSNASYWDGIYRGGDLQDLIYQRRQAFVLAYVDESASGADASILEIGCGAGHLTVELARRAGHVEALDASRAMVQATAARIAEAGDEQRVHVQEADVHALPFDSERFDLVVAVGVIPWLHSPAAAVAEMARVLRPGGQLIVTADNSARLTSFTDPRRVIAIAPLKRLYRRLRRREGATISRLDSPRTIDRLLAGAALRPVVRRTVGFGPLSFLGRAIFTGAVGVRIDMRLQALADRGVRGLRWTGWHYVVRAQKP